MFQIRWKGCSSKDDSWEPEENLDCKGLIRKFKESREAVYTQKERSLREAPKKVSRLEFASSHRVSKRTGGFRVTYEGMDD